METLTDAIERGTVVVAQDKCINIYPPKNAHRNLRFRVGYLILIVGLPAIFALYFHQQSLSFGWVIGGLTPVVFILSEWLWIFKLLRDETPILSLNGSGIVINVYWAQLGYLEWQEIGQPSVKRGGLWKQLIIPVPIPYSDPRWRPSSKTFLAQGNKEISILHFYLPAQLEDIAKLINDYRLNQQIPELRLHHEPDPSVWPPPPRI